MRILFLPLILLLALVPGPTNPQAQPLGPIAPAPPPPPSPAQPGAAQPEFNPDPLSRVKAAPTAFMALEAVKADAARLDDLTRAHVRYVWCPNGSVDTSIPKSVIFALNNASQSTLPYRPAVLLGGEIVRFDMRSVAPTNRGLRTWLETWELLAFDPTFSLLLTKDTLRNLVKAGGGETLVQVRVTEDVKKEVAPFVHTDGQTYKHKWTTRTILKLLPAKDALKFDLARQNPETLPNLAEAQVMLSTQAPVVHFAYFISRVLSTLKEDGIYRELWGGVYYELADIPDTQDALLEQLGVGNVKAGITAEVLFDKLRSDQRVGINRSKVTGRKRRAFWHPILTGRGEPAWVFITNDSAQKDLDLSQHAIANLDELQDRGREIIFNKPNGFLGYSINKGLIDEKGQKAKDAGKRVDAVPQDIANDRTVPEPHPPILQGAIACISCHGRFRGMQPLPNDVKTVLETFDVFGDTSRANLDKFLFDTNNRIAGWYTGTPDAILEFSRNSYSRAVLKATGPWKECKPDQTDIVEFASLKTAAIHHDYFYGLVSPNQALWELGFEVSEDDGTEKNSRLVLKKLLPPIRSISFEGGIIPEDPRIALLLSGIAIDRTDFSLVQSFMASRIQNTLKKEE